MLSQDNLTPCLRNYSATYNNFSWQDWYKEFSFFHTGKVNYAYEVTDYQVSKGNGDKLAIVSQNTDGTVRRLTFRELADLTNILAGNLQQHGLRPGDRFALYASRSIDYVVVLLAAIKCGAIAVPLFDAFGNEAVADRLNDCSASWIYMNRRLVDNVDFKFIPSLRNVLTEEKVEGNLNVFTLDGFLKGCADTSVVRFGDLETPFIIHYTSGSTAKPKGILLAQRAMIGHLVTARYVLDLHPEDHYWNSGDPGWVTGMVYNFFAPLLIGVAAHIFEGSFHPLRWVEFMEKMNITVWYSTPTAFRLLRYYQIPLTKLKLPKLRHIVSAGEPLNSSLVDWTVESLGIPIHDSWYMTENGHQLINNYRCLPIKKGSMGKPLPGIVASILDYEGNELPPGGIGRLVVKTPWPGLMKTVWNNPEKFSSYFEKGWYISGDMAFKDKDGYFWFQGREDDMIKSAGERISPFEIENVLVSHPAVAEAGVIGKSDVIYGSIVKAFIILKSGTLADDGLKSELASYVRTRLSAHETPREIEFVDNLPKTKSGKIMRRVLRSREIGDEVDDLSTLDGEMNLMLN